jgi:hypothetical protein
MHAGEPVTGSTVTQPRRSSSPATGLIWTAVRSTRGSLSVRVDGIQFVTFCVTCAVTVEEPRFRGNTANDFFLKILIEICRPA